MTPLDLPFAIAPVGSPSSVTSVLLELRETGAINDVAVRQIVRSGARYRVNEADGRRRQVDLHAPRNLQLVALPGEVVLVAVGVIWYCCGENDMPPTTSRPACEKAPLPTWAVPSCCTYQDTPCIIARVEDGRYEGR